MAALRACMVGALAVALGCGSRARDPDEIAADYRAQLRRIHDDASDKMVFLKCPLPVEAHGRGQCGLEADTRLSDEGLNRHFRERCGAGTIAIEDCAALLREDFVRALRKRYPYASDPRIAKECATKACNQLLELEFAYLFAHNEAVFDDERAQSERLLTDHADAQHAAAAQRESDAAFARGLAAALAGVGNAAGQVARQNNAPYTQSTSYAPPQSSPVVSTTSSGCSSDFDCGGPGYVCSKPAGQFTGTCAKAVNAYGTQEFGRIPSPSSIGPGRAICNFSTDCPVGFRCDAGRCLRN